MEDKIEYEIRSTESFFAGIRELLKSHELLYYFTWRDIKVRYKQATFGVLWAILQPAMLMVVFTLIFSKGTPLTDSQLPYPVFALAGLIFWFFFSNGVNGALSTTHGYMHVIQKIYFPRLVLPFCGIIVALFDFMFAFVFFWAVVVFYGASPDWIALLIYLPVSLLLCCLFAAGLGTFLAALTQRFKDFRYLNPFIIQVLFFVSPVLYSPEILQSPVLEYLLDFNPLTGVIESWRGVFTHEPLDSSLIAKGFLSATLIFVTGIYTFRKLEAFFADFA
jgi:lipopolysaccharide transport system permease protein